ncbi:MAG: adenylyltransferase/cytidyltransferase family protein [Patescibacteria group bacterium]
MASQKVLTLSSLSKRLEREQYKNKKIGVITGCFDIVHLGHIDLFRFAKKHVDILVVGLETDQTLRDSKGINRPVHTQKDRCEFISEISSTDYIFPIKHTISYGVNLEEMHLKYLDIYKKTKATHIITNTVTDKYWRGKKERAKRLGIKLLKQTKARTISTSAILEKGKSS